MKLCLLADTHGFLPEIEPVDLLIHAGDICPVSDHSETFQFSWLTSNFKHWWDSQPAKEKVYVAGNHDFFFEKASSWLKDRALRHIGDNYLEDEGIELLGYKIWGSPWQPWFHNWAFNLQRGHEIQEKWNLIPDDTEILITHGPPKNVLDVEGFSKTHVGCADLLERTWMLPELKLHVFGHIHHSFGQSELAEAQFVNASYVDEGYRPRPNAPIYLTLPSK